MIINYHNIKFKFTSARKIHFLLAIIFVANFSYLISLFLANLNIYGEKNHYLFSEELKSSKSILINKIKSLTKEDDNVLIISSSQNSFKNMQFFLKDRNFNFLEIPINFFNNNSSLNDNLKILDKYFGFVNLNHKLIIFDNSMIIAKYSCGISYLEILNHITKFSKYLKDSFSYWNRIMIFKEFNHNSKLQKNSNLSQSNQDQVQFLIYDYEIFLQK